MRTRHPRATALLVASPLLLVACSGEVSTSPADGGVSPATSSPSAPSSPPPPSTPPSTSSTVGASPSSVPQDSSRTGATPTGSPEDDQGGSSPGGRCSTDQLDVSLGAVEGGGAAGSTSSAVLFTNAGPQACTLEGYPGVSFVAGEDGDQVGAAAERDGSADDELVEIAPGAQAHAALRVTRAGTYSAADCDPTAAAGYRVYPPGDTAAAFVPADVDACGSQGVALLTVEPVEAGPPPR